MNNPCISALINRHESSRQEKCIPRLHGRSSTTLEYQHLTQSRVLSSSYFNEILSDSKVDEIDNATIGNFVLNLILPLPAVGTIEYASRERLTQRIFVGGIEKPVSKVEVSLAGSSGEGLGLPQIVNKSGKRYNIEVPDHDRKFIVHGLPVYQKNKKAFAYLERSGTSPSAFIRLRYNRDFANEDTVQDTWEPKQFLTDEGYVDRTKFLSYLKFYFPFTKRNLTTLYWKNGFRPNVTFSIHGPASTAELEDEALRVIYSIDYVICLPCPTWPEQAKEWKLRKDRVWPSKGLVKKVVQDGCHIVLKASKESEAAREEFLFSFSICDRTLCRSLNLNQKRCYLLFKYVFKYQINKIARGLASFFCKVTFLWLCERWPESEWRDDNALECLVALLYDFKGYLLRHKLPHYYIPEYNLLADMSSSGVKACVRDVEVVLREPWQTVLRLTENHRFRWLSRDVSLITILGRQFPIRVTGFDIRSYILSFLSELLDKVTLVLSIICRKWHWSVDIGEDSYTCIRHLEETIADVNKMENTVCLKALLANLYHQHGMKVGNGKFCQASLDLFQEIIGESGHHTWIVGCYYDILYFENAFFELVEHFVSKVRNEILYTPGIYTVITPHNNLTTTTHNFADLLGTMIVPSTAYILFKVTFAYMSIALTSNTPYQQWLFSKEALKVLAHFKRWVHRKCKTYPETSVDDQLYYLLGVSAQFVGDLDIARKAFADATSYCVTFWNIGTNLSMLPDVFKMCVLGKFNKNKLRFQPYMRSKSRTYRPDELPAEQRFQSGLPRVGEYVHF